MKNPVEFRPTRVAADVDRYTVISRSRVENVPPITF